MSVVADEEVRYFHNGDTTLITLRDPVSWQEWQPLRPVRVPSELNARQSLCLTGLTAK